MIKKFVFKTLFGNRHIYHFKVFKGRCFFIDHFIVDNAEKGLSIACEKCKAIISEYTAGPVYLEGNVKGAHEWLIEFEKAPEDISFFTNIFDNALKSVNSDYEAKRYHDLILGEPIIRVMPQNTFYAWLKSKGKLGGQHKVPRLSNDRKFLNEIMQMKADSFE